jgi:hypothetical protein
MPEFTPVGNPSWDCAKGNKQEGNQNEPAKDHTNQPWSVAGTQSKEKANSRNAADNCEEL